MNKNPLYLLLAGLALALIAFFWYAQQTKQYYEYTEPEPEPEPKPRKEKKVEPVINSQVNETANSEAGTGK